MSKVCRAREEQKSAALARFPEDRIRSLNLVLLFICQQGDEWYSQRFALYRVGDRYFAERYGKYKHDRLAYGTQ